MKRTNRVEAQLKLFREGIPKYDLCSEAELGSGIRKLDKREEQFFQKGYENSGLSVEKFVPASGAATRMFKDLLEAWTASQPNTTSRTFFEKRDQLPFDFQGLTEEQVLKTLFDTKRLDKEPKGLLPFHTYGEKTRTPVEEHMVEGMKYAEKLGTTKIHFTVSPEHIEPFRIYAEKASMNYSSIFEISYSIQNPETDTVAVDLNNDPVYVENDELLFRPAGHGALLENLNRRESDLIFIKNIDNVVPDRLKCETIKFKKVLAGVLLHLQRQVFDLLGSNKNGEDIFEEGRKLLVELGLRGELTNAKITKKLNRPIRVCGMVRNQGDPGGGPFWVKSAEGTESLQIVESAQIDKDDPEQETIFGRSTHFNPVDLVCGTKDFQGNKFDLFDFTDPNRGFITEKSFKGKTIKAMELPGLWNGGMADWNTIFIEVPLVTFNPVKTVIDLLKPEHQA